MAFTLFTVFTRRNAVVFFEIAVKGGVIREARQHRGGGNAFPCLDQPRRVLDPFVIEVLLEGFARHRLEAFAKGRS